MSDVRKLLAAHARSLYGRGWMVGTSGNLSARASADTFWITASGVDKGLLGPDNFLRMSIAGDVHEQPEGMRPSAETSIHQAVYGMFPDAQACYHVHTVNSNLVTGFTDGDSLRLPPLEMVKGLGVWQEEPAVDIAVFRNHLQVEQIAADMVDRYRENPPQVPGMLIRNHGLTVWASTQQKALQRVELFAYLFRFMVRAR